MIAWNRSSRRPPRRALAPAFALFALLACDKPHAHDEHEGEKGHDHAEEGDEHEAHGASTGNLLRIDHNLLRDLRVTTREAESRPAGDSVSALGELRVNEDAYAEVGSAIPARIVKVLRAPGDVVEAGQPLCELESADVGRARAEVQSGSARLELARQTVERRRALAADQIVSQRELEAAQAELAQAEAEQRAAEQTLSALGTSRGAGGRFTLQAPIAGTIIERNALRGRMTSDQPLYVIGNLSRLWLVLHAFERDALRMRVGSQARVSFPALPGQTFEGTLTRLGSRVDPSSRTLDVRVEVDNPSGVLRPGMSGSALIPLGDLRDAVVAVPVEAVQRFENGWCVFLPRDEEGVFEIRKVGRGRDLGAEVEVVSDLRAGERVVVDGAFLLKAEADKQRGGGGEHHHH